uniref:Protein phosphatase 1 regulatory subunit 35 n=1 Tax=Rousettus aegyptiacus TaxID=9407 RepID=A0A7J8F2V4_ROUAE|nr:protein phosphatase 1 regulatory subunit 35 [Rousettus aegyptiacus]
MMACGESELMSVEGEEAVAAPAPPPEPRAPEPGVPVPEPGLDLSLSSPSESPEQPNCSPGPRKGRADRRGPLPPGAALPSRFGEGAGCRHTEREARGAAGPRGSRAAEQPGPESRVAGRARRSRGTVRCRKGRGGTAEKVVPDPLWPGGERGGGAERAAFQAALPGPGESAGAGGTGSERCAQGEIGTPAAAGPSPSPKGATWARARHDVSV